MNTCVNCDEKFNADVNPYKHIHVLISHKDRSNRKVNSCFSKEMRDTNLCGKCRINYLVRFCKNNGLSVINI